MKKIALLLSLVGCVGISPKEDDAAAPASLKVYTVESKVCGDRGFGTSACVIQKGQTVKGQTLSVYVPNTNTQGHVSTIQLVSQECQVDESVGALPGAWHDFDLGDLIGNTPTASCDIEIVVVPYWQGQPSLQFKTAPMIGRAIVAVVEHMPAKLTYNSPFSGTSFMRTTQRSVTTEGIRSFVVDTNGSAQGNVLLEGCGYEGTVPYSAANPEINIPLIEKSCVLFGTVQPIDVAFEGSFVIAIDAIPDQYISLRDPTFTGDKVETDPDASAFEAPGFLVSAGTYTVPATLQNGTYEIRQTSTAGRASLIFVESGQVKWSMQ